MELQEPNTGDKVTITFDDKSSFKTVNPFDIAAELRRIVGEVQKASPTTAGSLLVSPVSQLQTDTLLLQKDFMGKPAKFTTTCNFVEAFIYAPSLLQVSTKQLLQELESQGVVGVKRLRPSKGKKNAGLRLKIRGTSLPDKLKTGFDEVELKKWTSSPQLCRFCSGYGHAAANCTAAEPQCLQCAEAHPTADCKKVKRSCAHCGGAHAAWQRSCPAMRAFMAQQVAPPPAVSSTPATRQTTESSTQTDPESDKTAVTTATQTCQPGTKNARVQVARPRAKEAATTTEDGSQPAQTDDVFSPIKTRWQRKQDRQDATSEVQPAPPVHAPESQASPMTSARSTPSIASQEEDIWVLLPPRSSVVKYDNSHARFEYEDGSKPSTPLTSLYRGNRRVLIDNLDLTPLSPAWEAARRGYYHDDLKFYKGKRLYLRKN